MGKITIRCNARKGGRVIQLLLVLCLLIGYGSGRDYGDVWDDYDEMECGD